MTERTVTLPTLALIAGTRVALGLGLGLLLADRLNPGNRRAAGLALLTVGALTTIPLLAEVLGAPHHSTTDGLSVHRTSMEPYVEARS
jgi:hypothetical protein